MEQMTGPMMDSARPPGPGAAYDAYRTWRAHKGPEAMVAAAVLAANARNVQPWWFTVDADGADVHADLARRQGALDPYDREMHVGLGCAVENMVLAARAGGYEPDVRLFPEGDDHPTRVARVALTGGGRAPTSLEDAMYQAIPHRRTNRAPFRRRPVGIALLAELAELNAGLSHPDVRWFTAEADRKRIGELLVAATAAIVADEEQSLAGHAWFRNTDDEIQRHRDGMTIDTQGLPGWLVALGRRLPPQSRESADRFWLRRTRGSHVPTAAAYGVLTVPDAYDNGCRIEGGRLLQRIHLLATARGLAIGHLNMMTVRADRERQSGAEPRFTAALAELVGDPDRQALMTFRIGHPKRAVPPSPRRAAHEVIR